MTSSRIDPAIFRRVAECLNRGLRLKNVCVCVCVCTFVFFENDKWQPDLSSERAPHRQDSNSQKTTFGLEVISGHRSQSGLDTVSCNVTLTCTWTEEQMRPLVREGASHQQTCNCLGTRKAIWPRLPVWCLTPRQTGRLTVGRNITLTLTRTFF
jgi:hypothetical protein